TRGRISTDSTGSSRPVNSSHSFTSFSTTVTTLTGSGPCDGADAFLHPNSANTVRKRPIRKTFFINAATLLNQYPEVQRAFVRVLSGSLRDRKLSVPSWLFDCVFRTRARTKPCPSLHYRRSSSTRFGWLSAREPG